jgi:hypothetical protein
MRTSPVVLAVILLVPCALAPGCGAPEAIESKSADEPDELEPDEPEPDEPLDERDLYDLPPLLWEGERVLFGTTYLDEVCAGTLAVLDATVISIEHELELPPIEDKFRFYVVDDEAHAEICSPGSAACVKHTIEGPIKPIVSKSYGMSMYMRHELVHARLLYDNIWGGRLFGEGIAAALDKDGGCLAAGLCMDLDNLLAGDFGMFPWVGYHAGADLVHGLLQTHGPDAVLAFMSVIHDKQTPDEKREIYLEHFDSIIDDDYESFPRRAFDEYTIAQLGCDGLVPAPSAGQHGGAVVHGIMDCSSPEVVNIHHSQTHGEMIWTFVVTPEQSGAFTFSFAPNIDYGHISLDRCSPPNGWTGTHAGGYTSRWMAAYGVQSVLLAPGQYQLRWAAPFDASIDIEIAPPCNFETGDCPAGEQCTIWNECLAEVPVPAALGQPCEQEPDGPLACEAGSRCIGGTCLAECDATQPCEPGQGCTRSRVCGPICDVLVQDCEAGYTCLPSSEASLHAAGLGACMIAGEAELLEECDWRGSECIVGLSCEAFGGGFDGKIRGECRPLCDPSAPACPNELPTCVALQDGPVGYCTKSSSSSGPPHVYTLDFGSSGGDEHVCGGI